MNNSEMMHFRAPPELAEALAKAAEREGTSQSNIIRTALAGRLGISPPVADPDPYERIYAAGRGDLQAMRDLAQLSVRWVFDPARECDPSVTLREGLVFARLAATHGDPADQGAFASMVALLARVEGDEAVADEYAEVVARFALIADAGNEMAAEGLTWLAEDATPEIMTLAKEIRSRLCDDVEAGR